MSKRTFAILIVLLLVIAGVVFFARRKTGNTATPVLSIAAQNQTKKTPATNVTATPGDVIVYALTAENQSDKVIAGYIMQVSLSSVTDKAALLDASGAQYNSAINSLVWTPLDIPAHGSIQKTFSVKISPLAAGSANTTLKINFNNEIDISIAAPAVVAGTSTSNPADNNYQAPVTGASDELPLFLAFLVTTGAVATRIIRLKRV